MKKQKPVKQVLKKILYVVVIVAIFAILAIPAVYMNNIYGYFPILVFAAVLVLSQISLMVVNRKLSLDTGSGNVECDRGGLVTVELKMKNSSRLFCPKLVANIFVTDLFWHNDFTTKTYFTLPPKMESNMGFDVDMNHIGVYHVGMQDVELYDFLGFFKKKTRLDEEFDVFVKPKIRELEEIFDTQEMTSESEHNERTTSINGNDYIGVRDYERGDSMKQIHWKLSARSMGYLTKLYEQSRQKSFTVILDFATISSADSDELMDINDCLIETALSVMNAISKQHTSYAMLFVDRDNNVQRRSIKDINGQMLDLIRNFAVINPNPSYDFPDATEMMLEENQQANKSTNVIVCTSRVTDELITQMVQIKRQRRSPELFYIVPSRLNNRELDQQRARLLQLDESAISYHFVRTSENLKARSLVEGEDLS